MWNQDQVQVVSIIIFSAEIVLRKLHNSIKIFQRGPLSYIVIVENTESGSVIWAKVLLKLVGYDKTQLL
jgi:hypothetical protein